MTSDILDELAWFEKFMVFSKEYSVAQRKCMLENVVGCADSIKECTFECFLLDDESGSPKTFVAVILKPFSGFKYLSHHLFQSTKLN